MLFVNHFFQGPNFEMQLKIGTDWKYHIKYMYWIVGESLLIYCNNNNKNNNNNNTSMHKKWKKMNEWIIIIILMLWNKCLSCHWYMGDVFCVHSEPAGNNSTCCSGKVRTHGEFNTLGPKVCRDDTLCVTHRTGCLQWTHRIIVMKEWMEVVWHVAHQGTDLHVCSLTGD